MIFADRVHFINILANLLDNANKYSPESPDIQVHTANVKNGLLIYVEDKGIGISKENQKQVFKKLYRVPTGNIHDVKGFGLGLFYVKKIVEAHGWEIMVKSDEKQTSFDISIPINNNNVKIVNNEEDD